jgi:hypothetical protein
MNEHELINEIKQITTIDFKMKIVDISDELLIKISSDQYIKLLELKKYKWSLQYIIE